MDRCPCRVHDGRRVVAARRRPTVCPARNEPPSQRDLRPAARRPSGGMPGGGGAGNPCRTVVRTGRQLNNNRIAADRSDVWGQRAVKRFLGATLPGWGHRARMGHLARPVLEPGAFQRTPQVTLRRQVEPATSPIDAGMADFDGFDCVPVSVGTLVAPNRARPDRARPKSRAGYMTGIGRYEEETSTMDLIVLARTIQADRERDIATEARRRRLLSTSEAAVQPAPAPRAISAPQRPASTGALSR